MQSILYFFPILTRFGISQQISINAYPPTHPSIKFHVGLNPCRGSRTDTCGQKTGMTKVKDAFCEFAKALKEICHIR